VKLAFSTLACPQWTTEQIINNAVEMGYDGLELRLLDGEVLHPLQDAEKIARTIDLARARGLEVCALDTSCTFNHSEATLREQNRADLQNWIRLAHEVHVPLLRIFGGAGKPDTYTRQEENAWVADALRQVASSAEQSGVTLVLETHDGFSSAHRVADVLQAVDSPNIAALWDSHHPYRVGESVKEVLGILDQHIAHVHIKDARRDASSPHGWQLTLVGQGEVPVREQVLALRERGYQGFISVEWEKKWHPGIPEPEVALPQHATWFRQVLS
jgi:sugar phosphate isomerase/epimerase